MNYKYDFGESGLVAMTLADIPNLVAKAVKTDSILPLNKPKSDPVKHPALAALPEDNIMVVRKMLNDAVINKDISENTAVQLSTAYANDPLKLSSILNNFAKMRIDYLMNMPWSEFDRGGYGEELQAKYNTGYKLKKYLQFGKKTNGVIDNAAFFQFAVENGYIDASNAWNYEETGNNTKEAIYNKIYDQILQSTDGLITQSWDDLSSDQLERLKQEAFGSYKKKYLEKFGIEYQGKH